MRPRGKSPDWFENGLGRRSGEVEAGFSLVPEGISGSEASIHAAQELKIASE
jgi:hypothetical protein